LDELSFGAELMVMNRVALGQPADLEEGRGGDAGEFGPELQPGSRRGRVVDGGSGRGHKQSPDVRTLHSTGTWGVLRCYQEMKLVVHERSYSTDILRPARTAIK